MIMAMALVMEKGQIVRLTCSRDDNPDGDEKKGRRGFRMMKLWSRVGQLAAGASVSVPMHANLTFDHPRPW